MKSGKKDLERCINAYQYDGRAFIRLNSSIHKLKHALQSRWRHIVLSQFNFQLNPIEILPSNRKYLLNNTLIHAEERRYLN